jgi:hypothetical protein
MRSQLPPAVVRVTGGLGGMTRHLIAATAARVTDGIGVWGMARSVLAAAAARVTGGLQGIAPTMMFVGAGSRGCF